MNASNTCPRCVLAACQASSAQTWFDAACMQNIFKTVTDIRTDDVLNAMTRDAASEQYVQARIAEILEGSLGLGEMLLCLKRR